MRDVVKTLVDSADIDAELARCSAMTYMFPMTDQEAEVVEMDAHPLQVQDEERYQRIAAETDDERYVRLFGSHTHDVISALRAANPAKLKYCDLDVPNYCPTVHDRDINLAALALNRLTSLITANRRKYNVMNQELEKACNEEPTRKRKLTPPSAGSIPELRATLSIMTTRITRLSGLLMQVDSKAKQLRTAREQVLFARHETWASTRVLLNQSYGAGGIPISANDGDVPKRPQLPSVVVSDDQALLQPAEHTQLEDPHQFDIFDSDDGVEVESDSEIMAANADKAANAEWTRNRNAWSRSLKSTESLMEKRQVELLHMQQRIQLLQKEDKCIDKAMEDMQQLQNVIKDLAIKKVRHVELLEKDKDTYIAEAKRRHKQASAERKKRKRNAENARAQDEIDSVRACIQNNLPSAST